MENNIEEKKASTIKAKAKLHRIEGFYPESELNEVQIFNEMGEVIEKKYYLPLNVKETWFWLAYPDGAIRTRIISQNEHSVRAECRLYRNYKDAENEYFVSAEKIVSVNYYDPFYAGRTKEEIIGGTINSAKAGAESIALTKGGFGIQIESPEESDYISDQGYEKSLKKIPVPKEPAAKAVPNVVPSPNHEQQKQQKEDSEGEKLAQKRNQLDKQLGGNRNTEFVPYQPVSGENYKPTTTLFEQGFTGNNATVNVTAPNPSDTIPRPRGMNQQAVDQAIQRNKSIPQPNIPQNGMVQSGMSQTSVDSYGTPMMTIEEARNVVTTISNPRFSGRTLGEIFDEEPVAVSYVAFHSMEKEREFEAASLLANSEPNAKAKLEYYLSIQR